MWPRLAPLPPRRRSVLRGLAFVALALPCVARAEPVSDISPEQFFQQIHSIALEPCRLPEEFGFDDTLSVTGDSAARFVERDLAAQFERAGLRVVPASEFTRHFLTGVDSVGGLFDPFTGEVDPELALMLVARARAAVMTSQPVDAWVLPTLLRVAARYEKGKAKWSSRSEVYHLDLGRFVPLYKSGEAPALSLEVMVEAPDGHELYRNEGGVELTAHIHDGRVVPLPSSAWFQDRRSVGRAVELAVWPLLTSSPQWDAQR